jgi:hypothetical protein
MEYDAPASVLLVKVATPLVTVTGVAFNAVLPLKNVTVPVGVTAPEAAFTVAVKVTLVPTFTGDAGETFSVVVVATLLELQFVSRLATLMEPSPVASS